MNTLKKFSVETHKGWASFQAWIKKWNKIMAVIFSALGITLLLSTVIVNALEVHEENQKHRNERLKHENPRLNLFEICHVDPREACSLYCSAGVSTGISNELNYHWEENPHCQSIGISIEVASTIYFPRFTIPPDWLDGNYKLKELQIDVENIFEICQNAFAGAVFEWMQKLVLINFHLHSMDTAILQKIFVEQHFKHLTITKNLSTEQLESAKVELHADSISYLKKNQKYQVQSVSNVTDTSTWSTNMNGVLIITLTIVSCMLSFSLGLCIRYNYLNRKMFSNKTNRDRTIFVIENKESV
ncbi:uncharacterized protein LOC119073282 isoform X2 [Bradysia coprophila]|uniref:uncharacterized protein LOC119073282 isoform X2 n=1 Tax=Bradysia coprophila TaxID=38358 RepID=UPI00187D89DF|nr:uncharacterized protein LOC119073282 isoform X2 [Bradysia coprophila]